ncbi:hypothetical protein [Streptomyces flavidovirens]|uniref:hypothetical protein n=1 Tax=Streptomyces flavidovirens TaxID=67298 RepID=UPI001AD81242|nr:hypothetical protein [Streptomyces flavidovirens]
MNATQQHMLDVYRATRLGTPAPPAPGLNDWQAVREVRDYRRLRATAEDRPPRTHRLRTALANLFTSATRNSATRGSAGRAQRSRRVAGAGSSTCG